MAIPLSILDLAKVPNGATSADALHATEQYARHADDLGYKRFWVAEHHNAGTVASTNPPVLMAHLAAKTERIRIGSGGVMLPNHSPLVVAEQFAMLESLHPNRIDLGIGRAPGTDPQTALALRGSADNRSAEDFPRHLLDVMGLLGDRRTETGLWNHFRATPVLTGSPEIVLLGSSGFSAQLAGRLGLPFAFAHHFDMGGTLEAAHTYTSAFEPSPVLHQPYLIVTATVFAADSAEQASRLGAPWALQRYGLRTGTIFPQYSPEEVRQHPAFEAASRLPSSAIEGTAEEVWADLDDLADRTGASELMLHTPTHSLQDRLASLSLIDQARPVGLLV